MQAAIVLNERDNVATALADLAEGQVVGVTVGDYADTVTVRQAIRFGHKFAIRRIQEGQDVVKYGEVIGRATSVIEVGEHAHVHNVESLRGRGDLARGS